MKLQSSSNSSLKFTLIYCLLTFIISIGPNGRPFRVLCERPTALLQLNNKKFVHYSHIVPEPPVRVGSFLQTEKRCLNRNEIEITPQPLEWRQNDHCFTQLKTTNLKTAKKTSDDYNHVEGECDHDEDDTNDGIEDDDDTWEV